MHNQAAISFHDTLASRWEDEYKSKAFAERIASISGLIPDTLQGQKWLDAGCGTGTISRWLVAERGAVVLAIDGSDGMLAHAPAAKGVEYRRADIIDTGLSSESLDGIVCSSVLEYLASPEAALREFHRLLKPGGVLLASVPNGAMSIRIPLNLVYWITRPLGSKRRVAYLDHSKHCYSAGQFEQTLRRSGFAVEQMVKFGRFVLPFGIPGSRSGILIMALSRKSQ
jgi:2-polyprenyl-6-hydroxyphenyl methylase/3-demethylubiquinone-9 3-methyltransferase